ncbi:REP-associated tyrosine transposase [Methylophaga thalassica]|uniref:REP-associated tyrosine transposase n=1 Tax=Methylophaga aminisulfidivorans TaxID=230105 RepID=UPI0024E1F3EF|nr:transposase [Methylophaga aminisulfidivorans]
MQYRRAFVPGGTFFFTVNLLERRKTLLTDNIDLLKRSFQHVKQAHPFNIDAIVILPEHLHTIWTLPETDYDFSIRWRLIKSTFSRGLPKDEHINKTRHSKNERGIWQRRYWEHLIRDEKDYMNHVDYIHYNPVKHGYVDKAIDWPHSSIHKFIRNGMIDKHWGYDEKIGMKAFGERT